MAQVRFIHAADIHLDSPLRGLERYEGAPVAYIRGATRKAFENLITHSLQKKIDFLLIAGDLYDGDWRDYNTGLFFVSQMVKLKEAGIPVVLIRGNHDALSQITKHLTLPDNVFELDVNQAETLIFEELNVAIHGQGFKTQAVTEDLTQQYPPARSGYFNIGLLHTCANGREGHESYAPCNLDHLIAKGYDYWALGHVHAREILHENPWIVFPGNTQGRHIRETGAKGCSFVTVTDRVVQSIEHTELDVLRWYRCPIDLTGCTSIEDVRNCGQKALEHLVSQADDRILAVRLELTGSSDLHSYFMEQRDQFIKEMYALSLDIGLNELWIEKVKLHTQTTTSLANLMQSDHAIATLCRFIQNAPANQQIVTEIQEEFRSLLHALPQEIFRDGEWDPRKAEELRQVLLESEELIHARLLQRSE